MTTASSSARVLIVDDFDDQRELYAAGLTFAGFDVDQAADGYQALDLATRRRPDVVVLDLAMPGVDGWETCRRLRAEPRTKGVGVIALTAHALPGVRESAVRAGCDVYLTKPCLPEVLVAEVRRLLGRMSGAAAS